jgi:hypothetical protein
MNVPNRMVIYPKDVMLITGIQDARTARKFLDKIRRRFKKEKGAFISLDEFCEFTGFKEDRVNRYLI